MAQYNSILIVEDDANLGDLLAGSLRNSGFEPRLCTTADSGLSRFAEGGIAVCILDIMLPGMDGLQLAKKIKAIRPEVPILFLTARSLKADVIAGYHAGCDDYITKPFEVYELILKLKAILARLNHLPVPHEQQWTAGTFTLQANNRTLRTDASSVSLSRTEYELLRLFFGSLNKSLTRTMILEHVWGRSDFFTSKSLDTYLTKIGKHLKADSSLVLENIHGLGYVLREL